MAGPAVLIIGAGPGGLFAAAELARHGVPARLVEHTPQPRHETRATSIKPGVLEILDSVGLVAPFIDVAVALRRSRFYDAHLTEFRSASYDGLDCRYDYMLDLPQYETLRILEDHLVSLGGGVERGVTAQDIEADATGVMAIELVHGGGRVERIHPDVIIGAGGAHSMTRAAMVESLEGATYPGEFLVADIAMDTPFAADEAHFVFGPDGFLQLAGLPDGRWICFQQVEDGAHVTSADDVADRVHRHFGGRARPTDVAWFSSFRMHRRMVSRLADGRRFLIGDAAHLASTFAGQGQNASLQDGYDLAWKLALVLRGHAHRTLLDDYAVERRIADRHILDVSDQTHRGVMAIADTVRRGGTVPNSAADPAVAALQRDASAMIDIDYAGSPLVVDRADGAAAAEPHPGLRYPDWTQLGGTSHRVLAFGPVEDPASLEGLERRWSGRVHVAHDPALDAARAGVPDGGAVLIRPDGHIGFRATATDADAFAALDGHLASYLVAPSGGVAA